MKRFFKILRRTLLIIIAFIILSYIAIQTTIVQNWLVGIATKKLSTALGTEVSIKRVHLSLFNSLNMEGTLVRDRQKDTLLYAGELKVRITDWFFLKDKAELKFAGLEDAIIKMKRTDSVWNYRFILDYFSSPSSDSKNNGISLTLKKLDFKNLRLIQDDLWAGERMNVRIGSLLANIENIDLPNNSYTINDIRLDNPYFSIQALTPLKPHSLHTKQTSGTDTGMYFNKSNMALRVASLTINNGNLFLDSDASKPLPYFDGSHVQLSKLDGRFTNILFIGDTIRAAIDMSARDRSGFEIKKLKTNFTLTPQIMEFANLDLQTNKSRLTNYYAMKFTDFSKDFAGYINKVVMDARFKNARINSDDIAFFAPELRNWKKETRLSGNFTGTVQDFNIHALSAEIGTTTHINGNLAMKGLPNINSTKILFTNGSMRTNYTDIGIFVPALNDIKSPNLAALGTIIYNGSFKGTINKFVTAGSFSTQLGGVKTDISMHLPHKGEPTYTGSLETIRFNMGKFLDNEDMGLVDFKGKITGSYFDIERLKTTLEGNIASLSFNNYTYTNIITNGTFQKKYFSGEVKVDDPNLDFTSNVEIDLTGPLPRFNIVGDLVKSNLKALNLYTQSKDSLRVTGLLDANLTGTNIDNFLGTAKFLNAKIDNGFSSVKFDSLNIISRYADSVKILRLAGNDFDATIRGHFNIQALPASFKTFLHHYYPTYIQAPQLVPQNQNFSFAVNTAHIEPYFSIFTTGITGFNNSAVKGALNTSANTLHITAQLPYAGFRNFSVANLALAGDGGMDTLTVAAIGDIQVSDSLRFPGTSLSLASSNDYSQLSVNTSTDNTLNSADLHVDVYTLNDGFRAIFKPSSFALNEKKWSIEKSGELIMRKHFIHAQDIRFTQGFQEISAETEDEDGGNTQNLIVKMKNLILGDFTSLAFKSPRLEGLVSGDLVLKNFFGQFNANAELKAEQFRMNDDSIGLAKIIAGYDSKTGELTYNIQSPNEGYRFAANGGYNLKDTTGKSFHTDIQLENSKIDILHTFLDGLFSDIKGRATGELTISGNPGAPSLLGHLQLKNAAMKVNYTQVAYTIDSANINFNNDGIDFEPFEIKDTYKNTGIIKGKLYEQGFKNLRFDFEMNTNKLLLIDTRAIDNPQFYGKAIGNAKLTFTGPENNCRMSIRAEANDTSHIYIPNTVAKESGTADFIVFKQHGTEIAAQLPESRLNMTVDLDLTVNNKVKIDVILDDLNGDAIKAVGNGRLHMKAGTAVPLSLRGRFNIDNGSYVFNFQGLMRKPFLLLPDAGNYIEWSGDPLNAELHIDARYTAERVSLSELVGNNFGSEVKGYRGDVFIIAQLRNKLTKPGIKFKIDFPQTSPVKSDNEFTQYINRLEKDQDFILNQVAYVILFNQFLPPSNSSSNTTINPYAITYNTLSQLLTGEVNKLLTGFLYKLTGDKRLKIDVGTSLYNSASIVDPSANSGSSFDRTRVDLKLTKAFAKDKIIVTVGGDLDISLNKNSVLQNGSTQLLPNINVELILSSDRKLRLIFFNRNSLEISGAAFGRRNRQGISISYRKDFEKMFGNKREEIYVKTPADSVANKEN